MAKRRDTPKLLWINSEYGLPAQSVTETFAFLGKRGGGKSSAAVKLAEEMFANGHQWVAIDPKGDWWGIRSSRDGSGPGLPVLVLGGRHGDLPLEASAGALIAELVVGRGVTAVLDVSLFSKAEQIRFVTDFAETLFRRLGDEPRPVHIFLEEAEEFLPQRVDARAARMVGAYSKIAKQGRTFGLGVSLITQRSASLNKDALSQTDTLVLFRTTSPHDRKAVVAWADHHGEAAEIAESLSSLDLGESWILSPGFLGEIVRVRWDRRSTFDSGSTPVAGGKRKAPTSLADIDLDEIQGLMAETTERAAENDPKALRQRVRRLENELKTALTKNARPAAPPEIHEVEVVVERQVEVIPAWAIELVEEAVRIVEDYGSDLTRLAAKTVEAHSDLLKSASALKDHEPVPVVPTNTTPAGPSGMNPADRTQAHQATSSRAPAAPRPAPAAPARPTSNLSPSAANANGSGDVKLGKREKSILTVLAQFPDGRTQRQIALLTGYSPKSSTIGAGLSNLRKHGFVTSGGSVVAATTEGVEALGGDFEPLPQGQALYDYWMGQLGARERAFLPILVDAYPDPVTHDDLAEATGYSPESSTIGAGMSKLRGLGLVDGWAASAEFVESIGR